MISRAKRKKLVELYPPILTLGDLVAQSLHCIPFPAHMLCGMTRGQFKHKNPAHQRQPNMSKQYVLPKGWGRALT